MARIEPKWFQESGCGHSQEINHYKERSVFSLTSNIETETGGDGGGGCFEEAA